MMDSNGGSGWLNNGVPLGFGMGLAMRKDALDNYSKLTEAEKEKLIAESKSVKSKADMEALINSLM